MRALPEWAVPLVLMGGTVFLLFFRKPILWCIKLLLRSLLGLGFLFLWSASGIAGSLALGVNVVNALILGLLGLPGLGLLLLFRWLG